MISFHATFESPGLAALRRQVPRAIAAGLNEGGDEVRTAVREALRTQTGVKAMASILTRTAASGVGANRAVPGRLIYAIVGIGKGMPITEFPVASTGVASTPNRGASITSLSDRSRSKDAGPAAIARVLAVRGSRSGSCTGRPSRRN